MTLVGKILTFLIFIMSLVFMTFTLATYASHRNWRDEASSLQGKYDSARSEWENTNLQLEELTLKLERERASRRESLATKESRIQLLTAKLNEETTKYGSMIAEHRKLIETTNMAQADMDRMKTELSKVRTHLQNTLSDRNSQLLTATETRDSLQETVGKLEMAERNINELQDSLSEEILKGDQIATGIGGGKIAGRTALDLDGQVTVVREDLVVVSLGSDEGLNTGDTLEVWRSSGAYIGRLVVVETRTDTAVARIVPEFLQGRIRQGDNVGTKLL